MLKIKRTGIIISVVGCIIITGGLATKSIADTNKFDASKHITPPMKQTEVITIPKMKNAPLPIKEKMLNAIDYYHTVQGTYLNKTPSRDVVVDFVVEVGKNPYSHVKIIDKKSGGVKKDSTSNSDAQDAVIVTNPYQFTGWLNDESKNYQIISNEHYLNRDATVIEGKLDPYLSQKFDGITFKMWVDTETGVLLKLITINEKNEGTSNLEVLKIDFNKDIEKN